MTHSDHATTRPALSAPDSAPWWTMLPYALISLVHVTALALPENTVAAPTKLLLMPALAVTALWLLRRRLTSPATVLLLSAIVLSWLGDGAGTFFPALPTLPMMLLFFALAHVAYIALFVRTLGRGRPLPRWSALYAIWWIVLVIVLWPHLGSLAIAVAAYGLVLGGTALTAARCGPIIATGGAFFLASDSILAFRLFLPDVMPGWTSPAVMLTYCLGQGLIAYGAIRCTTTGRGR